MTSEAIIQDIHPVNSNSGNLSWLFYPLRTSTIILTSSFVVLGGQRLQRCFCLTFPPGSPINNISPSLPPSSSSAQLFPLTIGAEIRLSLPSPPDWQADTPWRRSAGVNWLVNVLDGPLGLTDTTRNIPPSLSLFLSATCWSRPWSWSHQVKSCSFRCSKSGFIVVYFMVLTVLWKYPWVDQWLLFLCCQGGTLPSSGRHPGGL